MTKLHMNRRRFVQTMLAGSVAAIASRSFSATEHMLGDTNLIALSDGHFDMPSAYFLGAPQSLQDKLGDPTQIAANTYAYRHQDRTFMFDAGAGTSDFITQYFPTVSKLPMDLKAAGISADEVTDIVITHMHPDHIGGLVIGDQMAFPNARIHIAETEWDFWNAEGFATGAPEDMRPMIALVQIISNVIEDNIVLHKGSGNLGAGVNIIPAPGHTPGHTAIVLETDQAHIALVGDLTVHEDVHFENPDYGWAFDADGETAVKSRKSLLDMITSDKMVMGAAHVTKPGLGRVERAGKGYRFVAL